MTSTTKNTVPSSSSTFLADLQTFLLEEDADRFQDMFIGFIASGGTHVTGAGLVHTPDSLTAYPGGHYITETGAITYPDSTTHIWVICHKDTTTAITDWTRVSGTHYLFRNTGSGTKPALPVVESAILMKVTTSGGAVSVVVDHRTLTIDQSITGMLNVKDFGATGDGVTGESTAFTDTDAAAVLADNSSIYVPPGSYLMDANVTITSPVIMAPGAKLVTAPAATDVRITSTIISHGDGSDQFDITGGGNFGGLESTRAAGFGGHVVTKEMTLDEGERGILAQIRIPASVAKTANRGKIAVMGQATTYDNQDGSNFAFSAQGVLGQGIIKDTTDGFAWGGVFEALADDTNDDGQLFAIEAGVSHKATTGAVGTDFAKYCLWLVGRPPGFNKITAAIAMHGANSGFDYGFYMRQCDKEFIHMESPGVNTCDGIVMSANANWRDVLILPNNKPIRWRNAADDAKLNMINVNSANNLVLGVDTADQINIASRILPSANDTHDLGSAAASFRDIYFGGTIQDDAGDDVLGQRIATWTATTGTEIRTNFGDASLSDTSQALRALIIDLKTHGMIGDV